MKALLAPRKVVRNMKNPKSKIENSKSQAAKGELVVIRDEERIARNRKISQYTSLGGLLLLVGGMVLAFAQPVNFLLYQTIALIGGWTLSQIGLYLGHRYGRSPRMDEVLDEALKKTARNGRLYHYILPAPHVLLTPAGFVVLLPKFQSGDISADGDKWRQTGIGLRRFFGQEGLGNPTNEAESMFKAMYRYIHENVPEVEQAIGEVPGGVVIVFTSDKPKLKSLEVERSTIPAMHHTKLAGYLKHKGQTTPLPAEQYKALRAAFDRAAGIPLTNFKEELGSSDGAS
jgi:hypothetical protein